MKKYCCVNKTSGKMNIKQDNFLRIDTEKQKHAQYFLKIYRYKCSKLLERMIRRGIGVATCERVGKDLIAGSG